MKSTQEGSKVSWSRLTKRATRSVSKSHDWNAPLSHFTCLLVKEFDYCDQQSCIVESELAIAKSYITSWDRSTRSRQI